MDIIVEKLSKRYGDKVVLDNFSATFEGGKVTAVMGRSGVGKTTLLNCIACLTDFDGKIEGVNGVSYIFQEDRLVPHLTVYDNLSLFYGDREDIAAMLNAVGITEKAISFPRELSGGEKKRVALARAFLSDKKAMLLDEPMNSLDYGLKVKTYRLFTSLVKGSGITALYVTHDIDEALTVADEIKVISAEGVVYSHKMLGDKYLRELGDEECVLVRKELMNFLTV